MSCCDLNFVFGVYVFFLLSFFLGGAFCFFPQRRYDLDGICDFRADFVANRLIYRSVNVVLFCFLLCYFVYCFPARNPLKRFAWDFSHERYVALLLYPSVIACISQTLPIVCFMLCYYEARRVVRIFAYCVFFLDTSPLERRIFI